MTSLLEWLEQGPFTLALSSSFFGFYSHCGITALLEEHQLRPQKVTGSSAGALIGGAIASGLSSKEMRDIVFNIDRKDFWDPKPGLGLLRGQKFQQTLEKYFVRDFKDAQIPLEVAVFDIFSMQTKFLDRGNLPQAVVASCAVPLMFHPVKIDGRLFYDGGVIHKSGINMIDPDERILCVFLESEGLSGVYERKTTFHKLSKNHKVLRFKKLPKVDFYSLRGGDAAYSTAYERARSAIRQPSEHFLIEG